MHRKARKDANQDLIVEALRDMGVRVRILDERDLPDLVTGWRGTIRLLECKDGSRKPSERRLRPGQQAFFDEWQGLPVFKVETVEQALECHGIHID